jgi:F-type H+-transporting ATPase subunit b
MTFDATLVALIAFLAFFALMAYLKVPGMILSALDARSAAIGHELHEARRLREEAEALLADYQTKHAAAEAEAETIVANAKEQAASLVEETRAQMSAAIARRQRQAEEGIAVAEQKAEAEVRAAAADAAIAAAEKMLRERMNAEAQAKLVADGAKDLARQFG